MTRINDDQLRRMEERLCALEAENERLRAAIGIIEHAVMLARTALGGKK